MKNWMFVFNNCQHDARVLKEAATLAANGHSVTIAALLDESLTVSEKRNGFKIVRVSRGRFHGPLALLRYYWGCWRLIKHNQIDVFHCHDLETLFLGYLAARRQHAGLVLDAHELTTELAYIPGYQKLIFKILEKALIKKADAVIVPGQERGNYFTKKYQIKPPVVLLNCPPLQSGATSGQTIKDHIGIDKSAQPIILYTGGLVPGRCLDNLVRAAAYLQNGILVFLGWGPLEKDLRKLTGQLSLDNKVIFLKPVPPDELVHYISTASLGVVIYQNTGLNNYYASPNKLYEYLHAGLPVVCSHFPGLQKMVEEHAVGSCFDPDDPRSIASAIISVLSGQIQLAKIKDNALAAARLYNWERESSKLLEIYRRLEYRADVKTA